jgi:Predicted membrane protein
MKRRTLFQRAFIMSLFFSVIMLVGCGKEEAAETELVINQSQLQLQTRSAEIKTNTNDIVEIEERLFMTQISDIYYNFDEYAEKTIKVEGLYGKEESMIDGSALNTVFRYGPGCCGNDGWGGFYLIYAGEYPELDDWIAVTGTVEMEHSGQYTMMYLRVSSLEVREERGAEYVER